MVCTKDSNNKVCVGRTNLAVIYWPLFKASMRALATFYYLQQMAIHYTVASDSSDQEKRFKLLLAVSDRVALSVT